MYYWYAHACALVAAWLVRLAARTRAGLLLAATLAFACVASGLLALRHESANVKLLYTADEVEAARFVRENTPPRSLFLTAPSVHQPVLSLAGRAVVRGDTAWLWSHGYDFPARERDVRAIYTGRDDAARLLTTTASTRLPRTPRARIACARRGFFRTTPVFLPAATSPSTTRDLSRGPRRPRGTLPTARWLGEDALRPGRRARAPRAASARELNERPNATRAVSSSSRARPSPSTVYKVARGRGREYRIQEDSAVGSSVYVGARGGAPARSQQLAGRSVASARGVPTRFDGPRGEFVDALYANARRASRAERARPLGARSGQRRAYVLRHVAEERSFSRASTTGLRASHNWIPTTGTAAPRKDSTAQLWLRILRRTH